MNSWASLSLLLVAVVASINGLPVPDSSSTSTTSSESPSVFGDKGPKKTNVARSISTGDNLRQQLQDPSMMITRALEDVSNTLGSSLKNIGKSAIQILEGTSVGVEQALGTGARIITGVAETVGEAAETGSKGAIRIAQGVAKSLSSGTKSLVDTKVGLLQGLTGNQIQADASTNAEAVQRNERAPQTGFGGYATGGYGSNGVAETPGNFVNVFSQAAANTVNFGTQLLNSLVGVAANILQGTVSTLLSLLNAKGQVVGAIVQSAPPVLASVTRTAGDVLAAKARIFGAVTQGLRKLVMDLFKDLSNTGSMILSKTTEIGGRLSTAGAKALSISVGASTMAVRNSYEAATTLGSTLARTFGDSFGGLFQRLNQAGSEASVVGTSGSGSGRLGISGLSGSGGGGLSQILSALSSLGGGGGGAGGYGARDGGASGNLLGGLGNFAQTLINAKLNLLNGILSPFTGGRPLLNFGRLNTASSSSSSLSTAASSNLGSSSGSGGYNSATSSSEPTFRISIAGTSSSSPSSSSSSSTTAAAAASSSSSTTSTATDSETNPRVARFYANPDVLAPVKVDAELTDANLRATFKNGVIKGLVDTLNSNLDRLGLRPTGAKTDLVGSFSNNAAYVVKAPLVPSPTTKTATTSSTHKDGNGKKEKKSTDDELLKNSFSQILPLTFAHQIGQLQQQQQQQPQQQPKVLSPATTRQQRRVQAAKKTQ